MSFFHRRRLRTSRLAITFALMVLTSGCTSVREYVTNGLKVGPNYGRPPAAVAATWIDADDVRVRTTCDDLSAWWTVFHDPALDWLVCTAYRVNLTLREAGFRVLQARAQWAISVGTFFPQQQFMDGAYQRNAVSTETANGSNIANPYFSQWSTGFNLAWELDFWGRFRRAIESNAANLDASVEDYDDVLVTLLSDVATNYVRMRTLEAQIRVTQDNIKLQQDTLAIVNARFQAGTTGQLDVHQAASILEQTQSQIPELEIQLRQTINQLCILLGRPPEELRKHLGPAGIPEAPPTVAVGIPADLLRRRPDVRRAERRAAAQCALIGVAESEFYPHISVIGSVGYSAQQFQDLFTSSALTGNVGPTFQWNILNYGRILNNVRVQDAKFQELVANYQNTVLSANRDAENGLVTFLRAHQRTASLARCVAEAEKAVQLVKVQYTAGTVDFTRVTQVQQSLVLQQDVLMQARGEIAHGLISTYRALGGGWQIRINGCNASPPVEQVGAPAPERVQRLPPVAPVSLLQQNHPVIDSNQRRRHPPGVAA